MSDHSIQSNYDVAIIGGGINGLGIAREFALRNVSCILLEKNDFVSGTSSASSKLVHGGLRYLKQGQIKLVYEALLERHRLLKNAPHLVKPLPFLVPIYKNGPVKKWQFKIGLTLYDLLCKFHQIKSHSFFSKAEFKSLLPQIKHEDLVGGALYYDALMDDSKIGIEMAIESQRLGCQLFNYTSVNQIDQHNNQVRLTVNSSAYMSPDVISAKYVINATGPWSTITARLENNDMDPLVQLSKGVHIIVPKLTDDSAMLLLAKSDSRVFFVIPWLDQYSLVGTTDTSFTDHPDDVSATQSDIDYLIDETNYIFPKASLSKADIIQVFSGLRPLQYSPLSPVGSISRDYVFKKTGRLFHLTGGKYTTYRKIAEECCNRVLDCLRPNEKKVSLSKNLPLLGAQHTPPELIKYFRLWQYEFPFLTDPLFNKLTKRYGKDAYLIIKIMAEFSDYQALLAPTDYYNAEIIYFVRYAFAKTIYDIIRRRTTLFSQRLDFKPLCVAIGKLIQSDLSLTDKQVLSQVSFAIHELTPVVNQQSV